MTDNAPLTFVICVVALWLIGELAYRTWAENRPTRNANPNSARWDPRDWPRCDGPHCNRRGTNHIVWTLSDTTGNLCPGCRDTAVRLGNARDAWDTAS